ncbi:MAG: hypothetical protein AUG48_01005 [Actinobacteria bacterium 13_1_20CM_3_68_9]|nr:MAG: hypothetical protein AUG48_01005 [Actinobacteria bacterium 13_1_20CM_3_68_9]
MEADEPAHEDDRATEPPAEDEQPETADRGKESGAEGGPYGNPRVDEETLRKKQEEARRKPRE